MGPQHQEEPNPMSTKHTTQLPDPVYGSADAHPGGDHQRLTVSTTTSDTGTTLLHAHIGGIYLAMTERNWQTVWAALHTLEVPVNRTIKIRFNDQDGTATAEVVNA